MYGPPAVATFGSQRYILHQGQHHDGFVWSIIDEFLIHKDRRITTAGGSYIRMRYIPALALYKNFFYLLFVGFSSDTLEIYTVQADSPDHPQQPHHPKWFEDRGPNSYCYFSTGTGFGADPNEGIATSKTITVDPETVDIGTPFLIANLTQSSKSIAFPTGAMLTIQAPDGTIYNQEESGGGNIVIKSGSSLHSLLIKEPMAGDYRITLTVPPHVAFFFAFETLPYRTHLTS